MEGKQSIKLIMLFLCACLISARAYGHDQKVHSSMMRPVLLQSNYVIAFQKLGINPTGEYLTTNGYMAIPDIASYGAEVEDSLIFQNVVQGRFLNHFFDPTRVVYSTQSYIIDSRLSGSLIDYLPHYPSPVWAIESQEPILTPNQSYSLQDAYEDLYKGLTDPDPDNNRDLLIGSYLQSLFMVAHHVQDMSQPQHTRNDTHYPQSGRELYERYTAEFNNISDYIGNYPTVYFDNTSDYWFTKKPFSVGVQIENGAGKGLAEFTNRNFVTSGTNFDTNKYTMPVPAGLNLETIEDLVHEENARFHLIGSSGEIKVPNQCENLNCLMVFYETDGIDLKTNQAIQNKRAATWSILAPDYHANPKLNIDPVSHKVTSVLSLNRFNYDSRNDLVLPRAFGYSIGFLDHVMRGRVKVINPTIAGNADVIQFKIKNAMNAYKNPEWLDDKFYAGAKITLMAEHKGENGKIAHDNLGTLELSEDLAAGQESIQIFTFALSGEALNDPANVTFRLVYKGKLGEEIDEFKDLQVVFAEPFYIRSGFLVRPNYAPADGLSKANQLRLISKVNGQWKLSKVLGLQAGNVDWRGWYVDEKPTQVLTWNGNPNRYGSRGSLYGNVYTNNKIYKDGDIYAIAPTGIFTGAALTRDGTGKEWLVAVIWDNNQDIIIRRANEKSNSTSGWETIASFPADTAESGPGDPWVFNGSGSEAQTVRWLSNPDKSESPTRRYKISINTTSNTFSATIHMVDDPKGVDSQPTCNMSPALDQYGRGGLKYALKADGQYIFGVDYKNDDEVTINLRAVYDYNLTYNISPIENSDSGNGTGGGELNADYFLVINSHNGSINTSTKFYSKHEKFNSDFYYLGDTGDSRINNSYKFIDLYIGWESYYGLDARTGLIAQHDWGVKDTSTYNKYSDPNQPQYTYISNRVYDSYFDRNTVLPRTAGVQKNYYVYQGLGATYTSLDTHVYGFNYHGIRNCASDKNNLNPYQYTWDLPGLTSNRGSWLTDSEGNVLSSQEYMKGDDTQGYYFYVDGKEIGGSGIEKNRSFLENSDQSSVDLRTIVPPADTSITDDKILYPDSYLIK